jgi:hypothetical protein
MKNDLNLFNFPSELVNFINENKQAKNSYKHKLFSTLAVKNLLKLRFEIGLPYLNLEIQYPEKGLVQEALNMYPYSVSHRSSERHLGWRSLCLHGLSAEKTRSFRSYGYSSNENAPYGWTWAANKAPATQNFIINNIPMKKFFRVRWMFLEPGGYILPHSDYEIKDSPEPPGLSAINIAIIQPENCHFVMKDWGELPFQSGKALYIDNSQTHALVNFSAQVRVHLIIHGVPDFLNFENWVLGSFEKEKKRCLKS